MIWLLPLHQNWWVIALVIAQAIVSGVLEYGFWLGYLQREYPAFASDSDESSAIYLGLFTMFGGGLLTMAVGVLIGLRCYKHGLQWRAKQQKERVNP